MKNKTTENITIFKQVIEVMEKNPKLWGHVPKLSQAYDKFLENNKKIEDGVNVSMEDIAPFEIKEKETAEILRLKCKPILQVLTLWAKDANQKPLSKKLSSFKKVLKSLNPKEIIKISEFIIKLSSEDLTKGFAKREKSSDKNVAAISEFGITQEMLKELNETTTALEQIIQLHRKKKAEIEKAIETVEKFTSQNNKLLKTRISKFIVLFTNTQPEFHENFKNALKIEHVKNIVQKSPVVQKKNIVQKKNVVQKKTIVQKKKPTTKKAIVKNNVNNQTIKKEAE